MQYIYSLSDNLITYGNKIKSRSYILFKKKARRSFNLWSVMITTPLLTWIAVGEGVSSHAGWAGTG